MEHPDAAQDRPVRLTASEYLDGRLGGFAEAERAGRVRYEAHTRLVRIDDADVRRAFTERT